MPAKLAHFAIEADDVERARVFYGDVFGWTLEAWGPPDFYRIQGAGVHGALQKRQGPSVPGRKGFICSLAVTDLAASSKAIQEAGGALIGGPHQIPTVGELIQFSDTEGNEAIIIQYTAEKAAQMGL